MKIFILEDSVILRGKILVNLVEFPQAYVCGMSGVTSEALEMIEKQKPDLAIIDIRIFGGNGMDILKRAKEINPEMIAIVLTNYPYQEYRERCRELGADYFFDKSTEFEKAIEVIEQIVTRGEAHLSCEMQ